MNITKIILVSLAVLFFIVMVVSAARMNGTAVKTENRIKETKPFGKKEKLYGVIGAAIVTFLFIRTVVLWP